MQRIPSSCSQSQLILIRKTSCDDTGNTSAVPAIRAPWSPGQRGAMDRPRALGLLWALLTLCLTAGEWGPQRSRGPGYGWKPRPGPRLCTFSRRDSGGVAAGSEGGQRGLLHRPLWIPGLGLHLPGDCELRGPRWCWGDHAGRAAPHTRHQELDSHLPSPLGNWHQRLPHLGKGSHRREGLRSQHHLLLQVHFLP